MPDFNYHGPASLTILSEDNGEFTVGAPVNGLDEDTISILITPVNDDPEFAVILDQMISEDTASLNVGISGITAGPLNGTPPNEIEEVRFTATSDDTSIIPDPTINYSFFETTGSLDFAPVADAFGTVTITVTIEDAGLDNVFDDDSGTPGVDESADNLSLVRTFMITVNPLNDDPTLDPIGNQTIDEDAGPGTVALAGITAGPFAESETVRLSAVSSNTGIVLDPTITYVSPDTNATLSYGLVNDAFGGPVTITVTVEDAGLDNDFNTVGDNLTFTQMFDIMVNSVNDPPQIDPIIGRVASTKTAAPRPFRSYGHHQRCGERDRAADDHGDQQ